ncbi:MAG: NfeD family protein [Acidimicrobiales bacterium]
MIGSLLSGRSPRIARGTAWTLVLVAGIVLITPAVDLAIARQGAGAVLATRIADPITPVIADHLADLVAAGEDDGYEAVIVEMDTPGGLDTAMRDIVQTFLAAEVPVVVYVGPSGARAASAGALIAWSSNVVAMAPGTTIGAATPVALEGGEVGDKIVNDAAAYARAVAEERGRNVDVAAEAVTEGRALSATEAIEEDVADVLADDREALLATLDGTDVTVGDGATVTLRTGDAAVDEHPLSAFRRLLQWLADPNLAFLFMSLGTLGIIYELATPGVGAAGGTGVVLILLALFGLSVLPIDIFGVLFLVLAAGLFVIELFAPGIGVAAGLGSVSLALAGLFLFREEAPGLTLSLAAVLPTVLVVGVAVIVAGRLALRSRSVPPTTGAGALVGREITVARVSDQSAQALVEGAWWIVRSRERLEPGDRARVRDVDGLELVVDPIDADNKEAARE